MQQIQRNSEKFFRCVLFIKSFFKNDYLFSKNKTFIFIFIFIEIHAQTALFILSIITIFKLRKFFLNKKYDFIFLGEILSRYIGRAKIL